MIYLPRKSWALREPLLRKAGNGIAGRRRKRAPINEFRAKSNVSCCRNFVVGGVSLLLLKIRQFAQLILRFPKSFSASFGGHPCYIRYRGSPGQPRTLGSPDLKTRKLPNLPLSRLRAEERPIDPSGTLESPKASLPERLPRHIVMPSRTDT